MKNLLFIPFTVIALYGCVDLTATDNVEEDIYLKIESVEDARTYITLFPNGKYKEQLLERTFSLVSKISYKHTKSKRYQLRQQDFIYNDKGKLLAQRDSLGFGETYTYRLEYNADHQLIKKTTINNTSLQNTVTYKYNGHGQKIKEIDKYANGGVSERYFEYGANGLLLANYIKRKNKKIEHYTYSYDTNGYKQSSNNVSIAGVSGTYADQYEFTYDSQNNLVKETLSGKYIVEGTPISTSMGTREFAYDTNSNLIEESYEYESTPLDSKESPYYLASTTTYIRDKNGLLLEEQHQRGTKKNTNKQLNRTLKYQYIHIQLKDIF
ncbi:hypothetical protein [Vibrio algarum]|uniref:RHS repeat protein n=1 Tax=Vibrio algarum TaxID=3020714 RepID=A0ABT4YU40_9VIBR|nr:hypothetical protein [Vibrio sp. KJ40-1]MDB1125071.1 hypothetical protein [Vibrio sp. KJ40-1]